MPLFPNTDEFARQFDIVFDKAQETHKPVIIEFGANWSKWSKRFARVLASPIAQLHLQKMIHLRCPVSKDGAIPIDDERDIPAFSKVPFLSLFNPEGCLIDTCSPEKFERLWFYNNSAIYKHLSKWSCYPNIPYEWNKLKV